MRRSFVPTPRIVMPVTRTFLLRAVGITFTATGRVIVVMIIDMVTGVMRAILIGITAGAMVTRMCRVSGITAGTVTAIPITVVLVTTVLVTTVRAAQRPM